MHACACGRREHPAWGVGTGDGTRGGEQSQDSGGGVWGEVTTQLRLPHAITHVQVQRIDTCASVTQNTAPQDSAGDGWWSVESCPYPLLCKEMVKLE